MDTPAIDFNRQRWQTKPASGGDTKTPIFKAARICSAIVAPIMVDHALAAKAQGVGEVKLELPTHHADDHTHIDRMLILIHAITWSGGNGPSKAVLEILHFGGLTREGTAVAPGGRSRTVKRNCASARLL